MILANVRQYDATISSRTIRSTAVFVNVPDCEFSCHGEQLAMLMPQRKHPLLVEFLVHIEKYSWTLQESDRALNIRKQLLSKLEHPGLF